MAHLWREPTIGAENSNYKSVRDLYDAVETQLVDSVTKGQAIAVTEVEARRQYGDDLVIAALGVQIKDDTGPELKVRLLFDGTNGVPVNGRIWFVIKTGRPQHLTSSESSGRSTDKKQDRLA